MVSILATYFTRLLLFRGFKNGLSVVIPLLVITLVCGLKSIVKLIYQKMKMRKKQKPKISADSGGWRGCLN